MARQSQAFSLVLLGGIALLVYLGFRFDLGQKLGFATSLCKESSCSWEQVTPQPSPPARRSAAMAYDPNSKVTILFGGVAEEQYFDDTWAYNAATNEWREMKPPASPSPRAASMMVFDSVNKKFVLFGGFVFVHAIAYQDTWVYDYATNTWSDMKPPASPNIRASYALAFDQERGNTLLFGGFQEAEGHFWYNDTWTYNLQTNTWQELQTTNAPKGRGAPGFVYDSERKIFVLFGGFNERDYFNDTWTFDPRTNEWEEQQPDNPPHHRRTRLAYDSEKHKVILFGGESPIGGGSVNTEEDPFHLALNDDTWIYDVNSNSWQKIETTTLPTKRGLHSITYDASKKATVLYGGTDGGEHGRLGDTWLFQF